jgi:hypothetical protein
MSACRSEQDFESSEQTVIPMSPVPALQTEAQSIADVIIVLNIQEIDRKSFPGQPLASLAFLESIHFEPIDCMALKSMVTSARHVESPDELLVVLVERGHDQ